MKNKSSINQAKKWIGAFAAALGAIDMLVFSGGMGKKSPVIRSPIYADLEFLGIELEKIKNEANAPIISTNNGKTNVRVIHTDQVWMIAKKVTKTIIIN